MIVNYCVNPPNSRSQPGWEENGTNAFLRTMLTRLAGIDAAAMSQCTSTGLVVNIEGTGPAPAKPPPISVIAIRADMDALRMTEGNSSLPYRSKNEGVAHLCGHDGHMASLVGAATLLQRRRHLLPAGTTVRLLFQPAEEGPGGAAPMVKEGCMAGVDEVYGFQSAPRPTRLLCCPRHRPSLVSHSCPAWSAAPAATGPPTRLGRWLLRKGHW